MFARRRPTIVSICTLLALQLAGVSCASAQPPTKLRAGRTFYVASWGSDRNPGTAARPWRTVSRVNQTRLRPGDTILFQAGATFPGQLMPGGGYGARGTSQRPIQFASYGKGQATLPDGIWFGANQQNPRGAQHLTFEGLALGPRAGFQGTGDGIVLSRLNITGLVSNGGHGIGIETQGSHWRITANHIARTGNSGMLLGFNADQAGGPAGGRDYLVSHNLITQTGLDPSIGYPTHGIYLKVADARVEHNTIIGFEADGVSARYRNATIDQNVIEGGEIGIAWYEYDTHGGTTTFAQNTIEGSSEAGIFVCGVHEGCLRPLEHFVISENVVRPRRGPRLNLQPSASRYSVRDNR